MIDELKDVHNLTGDAAELRAMLLSTSDVEFAAGFAQALTNDLIVTINTAIESKHLHTGTAILTKALVARALITVAAEWWADGDNPRSTVPVTTEVLSSFITDLPPYLIGESFIPGEEA